MLKVIAQFWDMLSVIILELTKFFKHTIPANSDTLYRASAMLNDTVKKTHEEMLMENMRDIRDLREEYGLSEEEMAEIHKRMEY